MNFKTTLILLVALVAVAAYVMYDQLTGKDKDKVETVADTKKLFDVKKDEDVQSLTIRSADGEIVLSKGEANKWRMTKPVESAAESWQVDGLVRKLVDLESSAKVDPKDKGLDKPRFNIEISAKGGKLLKFAVGDKNQTGQMYVQVAGKSQADVVPSDVYEDLGKPANELRDKQLVTVSSADIKQLSIQTEGQKLVLAKGASGWEVTEPKKLPADDSVVMDLLGAVTGLRATDWVPADTTGINTGFDKPQMTVAFTTAAPATQPTTAPAASQPAWTTITFGAHDGVRKQKVFAMISDTKAVVKVNTTPITTLTKKPIELRDKKVFDILPEQVSKLSIATDVPGSPAPAVKPGKKTLVEVIRRKEIAAAPTTAPATPTPATTKPATTKPTTTTALAAAATTQTTQPATTQVAAKPAAPLSTWELKSDPKGEADDEGVRNLLADLHPLRASKFLESTPTAQPTSNISLKLTTEGPGGTPVNSYELKLVDPGNDQAVLAEYNGLAFELPRTFLTKLEGNFAKKPKIESKPDPETFKIPGRD